MFTVGSFVIVTVRQCDQMRSMKWAWHGEYEKYMHSFGW